MSENIGYEPTIGKDTISQASEHERDKWLGQVKEQSSSEDQNWGTLGDLMERKGIAHGSWEKGLVNDEAQWNRISGNKKESFQTAGKTGHLLSRARGCRGFAVSEDVGSDCRSNIFWQ
jgi:hypothetical protein